LATKARDQGSRINSWRQIDPILTADLGPAAARAVQRAAQLGELAKIRDGVYTAQPESAWPELVRRSARDIASSLFPGAVASWQSGSIFGAGAPAGGFFFLSYRYSRDISLPGLTFRLIKGPGPVVGDVPWKDGRLHIAGRERALLENLAVNRGPVQRATGPAVVRGYLSDQMARGGEEILNTIRDQAREIAPLLHLEREMKLLDGIISKLLTTYPVRSRNTTPGRPVDDRRLGLLDVLAKHLATSALAAAPSAATTRTEIRNSAFVESYFSNYIEGTEFEVKEAIDIAFHGKLPMTRPQDAHDILGVMEAAQNPLMRAAAVPAGPAALSYLSELHRTVLRNRPEISPGAFKEKSNRAGTTEFVHPDLVQGTLLEVAARAPLVPEGLPRALFTMFGITEVHPFSDGNGRIARLAMNAELSRCGLQRIIVPTVSRDEYLDGLRALSRNADPVPLIAILGKLQSWSAAFDYADLDTLVEQLRLSHAFETERNRYRLLTPASSAA